VSEWFCQVCNRECKTKEGYEEHIEFAHVRCSEPGCTWSGPETSLAAHGLKHVKAADGKSVVESPEELKAWRNARKRNFPCPATEQRKIDEYEKRRLSGALDDAQPEMSMLEKLLRRSNDISGRKGFGKGKKGKFGKDDGKGKYGKGKGKDKGKKGKGKDKGKSKGKGKGKGKKSWGWNGSEWNGDESQDMLAIADIVHKHPTADLPLPSVLANCVPLEAPFGAAPLQQQPQPQVQGVDSRRFCKYFSQGFCFHGARCRYQHEGQSQPGALAIEDARAAPSGDPKWWLLPSTLANRACGYGEGPAAYHGVARKPRGPRYEAEEPPEDRPRREGLLRRLMNSDVDRYYSAILQSVRYIVGTEFFKLEKVPLPPALQPPSLAASTNDSTVSSAPAKDLGAASLGGTGASAGAGAFSAVSGVVLEDEELLELAKVLDV